MKKLFIKTKKIGVATLAVLFLGLGILPKTTLAEDGPHGISMSPLSLKIVLNPGDIYNGSFTIRNAESNGDDFKYRVFAQSFYMTNDENGKSNFIFNEDNDYSQIVDWVSINSPQEGILARSESVDINYTISVPEDAHGGGQYVAITVASNDNNGDTTDRQENSLGINDTIAMAFTIYAEITGDTIRDGEIIDANVPPFILSGNIIGSSSIKNTGNVHGTAKYTLQVFPLFSDEEIYTNEEDPETHTILPDRVLYNESSWDQTPSIGVFNVVYTVEFEGTTAQVSKMVIKCPIWLLFIILFAIAAFIIWIIMRVRSHNKARKPVDKNKE